jgi:hypothetical protein
MKYSKKHIAAVEARLQEYERVLALPEFERLDSCHVCKSLILEDRLWRCCSECLFNVCFNDNIDGYGEDCNNQAEQRAQFNHLKKMLAQNGYEYK